MDTGGDLTRFDNAAEDIGRKRAMEIVFNATVLRHGPMEVWSWKYGDENGGTWVVYKVVDANLTYYEANAKIPVTPAAPTPL